MKQQGTKLLLTEVTWTGGTRNRPCLLRGGVSAIRLSQGQL